MLKFQFLVFIKIVALGALVSGLMYGCKSNFTGCLLQSTTLLWMMFFLEKGLALFVLKPEDQGSV